MATWTSSSVPAPATWAPEHPAPPRSVPFVPRPASGTPPGDPRSLAVLAGLRAPGDSPCSDFLPERPGRGKQGLQMASCGCPAEAAVGTARPPRSGRGSGRGAAPPAHGAPTPRHHPSCLQRPRKRASHHHVQRGKLRHRQVTYTRTDVLPAHRCTTVIVSCLTQRRSLVAHLSDGGHGGQRAEGLRGRMCRGHAEMGSASCWPLHAPGGSPPAPP